MICFKLSSGGEESPGLQRRMRFGRGRCVREHFTFRGEFRKHLEVHRRPRKRHRRHRLRPRRPRPSANRLGQAARPARRRGDREQEVVELNSCVRLICSRTPLGSMATSVACRYWSSRCAKTADGNASNASSSGRRQSVLVTASTISLRNRSLDRGKSCGCAWSRRRPSAAERIR
jgi:hypothetical protein